MMKQSLVQETLAELSANSVLPPLHNLPHWSRVNNFDKARYPKPFLKDRLQPLPNPTEMEAMMVLGPQNVITQDMESHSDGYVTNTQGSNQVQRVIHLERSIHFLQQQHHEVLTNLHDEIDDLKRANKELQFQIVMIQKNPSHPSSAGSNQSDYRSQIASKGRTATSNVPHPPSASKNLKLNQNLEQNPHVLDEKMENFKILFLEEEIKELKKALKEERSTNQYLQELLNSTRKQAAEESSVMQATGPTTNTSSHSIRTPVNQPNPPVVMVPNADKSTTKASRTPPRSASFAHEPLPFNATLNPLRVQSAQQGSRVPNMQECEMIIRHLQRQNDSQAHELNRLKSDLRDVLYSHKWTPDAYLLAKAYVAEDDAREVAEQGRLPRVALKHNTRKLPDGAYLQKDAVSLPALKQTLGNKAIERRKRAQILQKTRFSQNKEVTN